MKRRRLLEQIFKFAFPQWVLLKNGLQKAWKAFECYKAVRDCRQRKMKRPIKIAIGSGVMFVFIIVFGWFAFPKILNNQIKNMVSLKKGNDVRDLFLKVPFPLVFKIYLFNITNPSDVTEKGAVPVLNEIGPFVYDEWKEKVNIEENEEDDTLLYTIKNTFIFNAAESSPLTGNEAITMLHPLVAGLVLIVEKEKPAALALLNKALAVIYKNPQAPFVTTVVKDILFDGIDIHCNVTEFAGKAVCTQLKAEAKDLIEVEPGIFKFSLFGPKNATLGPKVKVKRGIKKIHDLGRVIEYEGKTELDIWAGKPCNTYEGTDSTIFPPFLTPEEGLVSFSPDICRSLTADYVEDTKYAGLPVRRYRADFGDMSTVPEEKCYCPTPETCLKKGVVDLTKCLGAPLYASLPHFYLADPVYQNGVRGLNPNERDHEITIFFESMTGSPVSAKKRMQFSMPIHSVPKISFMKNIPDTLFPIMWVEEGVDLNKTWTGQINNQLFRVLKIFKITKYLILVGSIVGLAVAGYMHYTTRTVEITPIHGKDDEQKRKDVISMLAQNDKGHVNPAMENEIEKY